MIKKELFIEGVSVPISDMGIDWVKEIADISQPDTRQSGYSRSIEIHGTKEVNKLFGFYYDVNVDSTFDASKKANAVYYEDTIQQLTGFFRLTEVNILNDVITYKGTLHGELSSIFKDMGDSLISELDWSDLDHTYSEANIRANWAGVTIGTGYIYPMIDYLGKTPASAYDTWAVTDFRPAVFFKEIWDRIFDYHGYTYTSTLIDDDFLNLVMPARSTVLSLSAQQILDQSFYVGKTGITQYNQDADGFAKAILFDDDSSGSFYNTLTDQWVFASGFGSYYETDIVGNLRVDINASATITLLQNSFVTNDVSFKVRLKSTTNPGGSADKFGNILAEWSYSATFAAPPIAGSQTPTVTITEEVSVYRRQGEYLYLVIEDIQGVRSIAPSAGSPVGGAIWGSYVQASSELTGDFSSRTLASGDPMVIANALPTMKQRDFVMGVIKAFNVYVEDLGEKDLLVESYNDYYTDDVVDWTNKKNGGFSLTPNGTLEGKSYNFTFEKDEDEYHKKYLKDIGEEYGDYTYSIDNDFQTSAKEIALPFGSTVLTTPGAGANDRPIPTLYSLDSSGVLIQAETKPRMLYYAGFVTCKTWTFATGGATETSYPYAGDTWNPYGDQGFTGNIPTILRWQQTLAYYFDGDYPAPGTDTMPYGGTTLYSNYEEMISYAQNPVFKADFYLTPLDIYNLSFRKKYFIDTAYYRLIKLTKSGDNYNGEFLKIG